jgi:hypothetical protein
MSARAVLYLFFAPLAGVEKTEATEDRDEPFAFAAADFFGFLISRLDRI